MGYYNHQPYKIELFLGFKMNLRNKLKLKRKVSEDKLRIEEAIKINEKIEKDESIEDESIETKNIQKCNKRQTTNQTEENKEEERITIENNNKNEEIENKQREMSERFFTNMPEINKPTKNGNMVIYELKSHQIHYNNKIEQVEDEITDVMKKNRNKKGSNRKIKNKLKIDKLEGAVKCKKSQICLKVKNKNKKAESEFVDLSRFKHYDDLPEPYRTEFYAFCDITAFYNKESCFNALKETFLRNKLFKIENTELRQEEIDDMKKQRRAIRKNTIRNNNIPLIQKYNSFVVKNSKIHGSGVFTEMKIPEDTFLFSYEGELIGKCMSDKREREYIKNGIKSIYMFAIDDDKIIDATKRGNLARYVNHSCKPNCYTCICDDTQKIKYYSDRIIDEGEEITIDYFSKSVMKGKCNCGSLDCKYRE